MCRRTTTDPLVRRFLDTYGLHLLAVPRRGVRVGDVYAVDGSRTSPIGRLDDLLDDAVTMPVVTGEVMADIVGQASKSVSAQTGLQLLEGFLVACGAGGLVSSAKVQLSHETGATMSFAIEEPIRDHVDALALGVALDGHRIRDAQPFDTERHRFYVATAVARSRSIKLAAQRSSGESVDLSIGVAAVAAVHPKVTVTSHANGAVTYTGPEPLAFGVELFELAPDAAAGRLGLRMPSTAVPVRGRPPRPARALLGDPRGDAFIVMDGPPDLESEASPMPSDH